MMIAASTLSIRSLVRYSRAIQSTVSARRSDYRRYAIRLIRLHISPLIFEFSGKTTQVGDVTLFSSREVVFSRIMISIYFLIGNAMIKTTFLIILFLLAFRKRLTEPLAQFTEQIEDLELNDLEGRHIEIKTVEHNELKVMEESFNRLIDKVVLYREELEHTQKELLISNEKLDQHNLQLEQK